MWTPKKIAIWTLILIFLFLVFGPVNVSVRVGKNFDERQTEALERIADVLEGKPAVEIWTDDYFNEEVE